MVIERMIAERGMNLLEIRTWFVRESGRYDLIVGDPTGAYTDASAATWCADKGANNYINAGQRMLDRMQTHQKTLGRNFALVEIGQFYVTFPDCRAIKEVWGQNTSDPTQGRYKLEKKSLAYLRKKYANMVDITNGKPKYYAPAVMRPAPTPTIEELGTLIAYADILTEKVDVFTGLIFFPPADAAYSIETWAMFYQPRLVNETDETYWSIQHPELLVMAAQCMLEKFSRNTEGVKDWIASVQTELDGIDKDLAEEEIAGLTRLGG